MYRKHRDQSVEETNKRKKLKMQMWELDDEFNESNSNSNVIDIKDVEFRLNNDMKKVQVNASFMLIYLHVHFKYVL